MNRSWLLGGGLSFLLAAVSSFAEPITLFVTSDSEGRLERCGCSANVEGGLEARAGFLENARAEHPNSLRIDLGGFLPNLNDSPKPAQRLSNETDVNQAIAAVQLRAMGWLRYDIVLPGLTDLAYPESILKIPLPQHPFYLETGLRDAPEWMSPLHVVDCGEWKIGFLGVATLSEKSSRSSKSFFLDSASVSLPPQIERLRTVEKADAVVLLAHEPANFIQQFLLRHPDLKVDLALGLDVGMAMEKVNGTYLTNAPGKGKAIAQIDLNLAKGKGIVDASLRREPLDPQKYSNREMNEFLHQSYREMVRDLNLSLKNPAPLMTLESEKNEENGYVGAQSCMACHVEQYRQWEGTQHSYAFHPLLEQNRYWVPECQQCHVTGYGHPQGFQPDAENQNLLHVQCETCHGPGQKHVDEFGIGFIRRQPDTALCKQCHDAKNSPRFDAMADLYYQQIKH